jgi:hypothetical protein
VGVSSVTATATRLEVAVNRVAGVAQGSDADALVIDFSPGATELQVTTGSDSRRSLSVDGDLGVSMRATGDFQLSVADFFHVEGSLGLEKHASEVILADGRKVQTDYLGIGGSGLDAFAGLNGPYRSGADGDADGLPDTVNPDALGFSLSDVSFGLALMSAQDGEAASLQTLRWMALEASASEIAFVGVDALTLQASDVLVSINQVSGQAPDADTRGLVVDLARSGVEVLMGTDAGGLDLRRTLSLSGDLGEVIRVTGDFELSVGDFFHVGGSLGFEQSTRDVVLADGTQLAVRALTVGGADLQEIGRAHV